METALARNISSKFFFAAFVFTIFFMLFLNSSAEM